MEKGQEGIPTLPCPMYPTHSLAPGLQPTPTHLFSPSLPPSLYPDTPPHSGMYKRRPNTHCRQNQRSPPPIRQLVSIRCSKSYKYSLFSLILYDFSFPFLMFPAFGSPPGRRPKLRSEGMPSFALTILSYPRPRAEESPEMMASCWSSLLLHAPKLAAFAGEPGTLS